MLRQIYSGLIRQSFVRKAVLSTPGVRQLAWQFVAGENLEAGVAALRALNARGMQGSLNYVGTHVHDRVEAVAAADAALAAIERIQADRLDADVSIKPTQLGLDIDEAFCREQLRRVIGRARTCGVFVRIDMEESQYVEVTLRLFEELRDEFGPETVGIVIQSYLRNRSSDLARVLDGRGRVRLCKGGYLEPATVTYRQKADIDRCFGRDLELLRARGVQPAIATHDPVFITRAKQWGRSDFSFEMLYGVRPELQEQLVREGYRVRCYVPYGGQWFAYFLGCVRRML